MQYNFFQLEKFFRLAKTRSTYEHLVNSGDILLAVNGEGSEILKQSGKARRRRGFPYRSWVFAGLRDDLFSRVERPALAVE